MSNFTKLSTTRRNKGLDYHYSYRVQVHDENPDLMRLEFAISAAVGLDDTVVADLHERDAAHLATLLSVADGAHGGTWSRLLCGALVRVSRTEDTDEPLRCMQFETHSDEHGYHSALVYLTEDEAEDLVLELDVTCEFQP